MGDKSRSVQISKLDCLKRLDELAPSKPKHQKLGNFENLQEILSDYDVSVTTPPSETETRKKWHKEKQKLLQKFDRILNERSNCYKKKNYNYNGLDDAPFFDSENYKLLTTVTDTSSIDPDYVMENDTLDIETETKDEPTRKIGKPPDTEKPLLEFSDGWIREQLRPTYHALLKKSSELKIPFDKCVAKMAMMHYFTAGENFNKQKGQMFSKVVTLKKF